MLSPLMNANASRLLFGFLWVTSLAAAFFLGLQSAKDDPTETSPNAQPARPVTLGGSAPPEGMKGREKAVSDPLDDPDLPSAERVRLAVATAKREMGSGGGFAFSPSTLYRAIGTLMELRPDEVQSAIAEVEHVIDQPQHKQMMLSLLLGRWAEESPREALAYAERIAESGGPASIGTTMSVLGTWARKDPEASWQWYLEKRDSDEINVGPMGSDTYLQMIFGGMADRNLDRAIERLRELDDDQARRMASFGIANTAAMDPEKREAFLDKTATMEDDLRLNVRQSVIGQWAMMDTDGAMDWIRGLPAEERAELANSSGYSFMWADPEKGAEFLLEDATEETLPQRYQTIISAWANRDPNAAGEWLNAQPASPAQDGARSSFAMQVARRDPESAMEWAKTVSDESRRFSAVHNVYLQWRKKDADAADSALANSNLPTEKIEQILATPDPASPSVPTAIPVPR